MKFLRRRWYDIGLVVGLVTAVVLCFIWSDITVIQRLLLMNFIVMTVHEFEEFGFPGGMPILLNKVKSKSESPDRYPMNQNGVMVGNLLTVYGFYLLAVFFPDQIWFGLAGVLIGLMQTPVHVGVAVMLRNIYAPGNLAVFLGHIPVGCYFIYYGLQHNLISGMDWVLGALLAVFNATVVVAFLGYKVLADKNSPYPFSEEEMHRPWMLKQIARMKH